MERLWSPWRLAYVTGAVGGTHDRCIFCDAGPESSRDELVLIRTPLSYVVLNLYPYNNGHLMVVPNRQDRKSTRLNSSHVSISYAVFCLKKKKTQQPQVVRSLHPTPGRDSPHTT